MNLRLKLKRFNCKSLPGFLLHKPKSLSPLGSYIVHAGMPRKFVLGFGSVESVQLVPCRQSQQTSGRCINTQIAANRAFFCAGAAALVAAAATRNSPTHLGSPMSVPTQAESSCTAEAWERLLEHVLCQHPCPGGHRKQRGRSFAEVPEEHR